MTFNPAVLPAHGDYLDFRDVPDDFKKHFGR